MSEFLSAVEPDEVGIAVAFLTGRAFPSSDPRVLGVRGLPEAGPPAGEPSLTLADVAGGVRGGGRGDGDPALASRAKSA